MNEISVIKKISIWIFLIPFFSINICLILSQIFPFGEVFAVGDAISEDWRPWIIPYIDGHSSISRVVRVYPNSLIFKPAMIITAILLIMYWMNIKKLIQKIIFDHKHLNKIFYCGIGSAIFLILHSAFLGIKFDINLLKLLRRIVLLSFIILEITAQAYLIFLLYEIKSKINTIIDIRILRLKRILVTILIITAILIGPFLPFSNLKVLKHMIEWNYLLGVILFYFLTFLMWKNKKIN
tara:strand:- start:120 stop:833 length:714 start_codon:yes stop_codon:yes gene_type:complete